MAPDDAATFAALPETLRLYRDRDDATRVGLSWRLREGVGMERSKEGIFIEAKTPKSTVAGLYGCKNKTEIVLYSCRHIAALS